MENDSLKPIDSKMLQRIQALRLMDDEFMSVVFDGDILNTEFILRIILDRTDLSVKSVVTQKEKRNLYGRSVRLDILAEDTTGKIYNVEVQRADKGASPKRVRYNMALLDSHSLKKDDDFEKLQETYIIFITENDYFKGNQPLYKVKKLIEIPADENQPARNLPFKDGCNIIYVNGSYRGQDALGRLMHDFCTASADQMYYKNLAKTVRHHKQQKGDTKAMSKIFEEYGEEVRAQALAEGEAKGIIEVKFEAYLDLIKSGLLSIKDAAMKLCITEDELQAKLSATTV